MTNPLTEMTPEQLVDMPGPTTQFEFMRRQTIAQQETAEATARAAKSAAIASWAGAFAAAAAFVAAAAAWYK